MLSYMICTTIVWRFVSIIDDYNPASNYLLLNFRLTDLYLIYNKGDAIFYRIVTNHSVLFRFWLDTSVSSSDYSFI